MHQSILRKLIAIAATVVTVVGIGVVSATAPASATTAPQDSSITTSQNQPLDWWWN